MAVIVKGTTIPENLDSVYANNVNIDKIVSNGVVVWQKQKNIDLIAARPNGWNFHITGNDGRCDFINSYIESYNSGSGNHDNYYYGSADLTGYNRIRIRGWGTGNTAISCFSEGIISVRILQNNSVVLRSAGIGVRSGATWVENEPANNWNTKMLVTASPYSTNGQDAAITVENLGGDKAAIHFDMNVNISKIIGNCQVQLYFSHWGDNVHTNSTLRVSAFQLLTG